MGNGRKPPMHVLILDDDCELIATLTDVLAMSGHTSEAVATIEEARSAAGGNVRYDAMVLDVNLREDNSIALLRELRQALPQVRLLCMTGGGRVGAEVGLSLAMAHGADQVMFKPFSNQEFLAALTGADDAH